MKLIQTVFKYILVLYFTDFLHIIQTVASPLRLKLFHDVQKIIVDLWLVAKLQFDLVQVGQSIFHL